jgi:serine/threonine protein kinase
MAPEMLANQNYSFSADHYAIGIILYEIIMGSRPFKGKTRKQMRDLVAKIQPKIEKADLPTTWSESSRDLTNRLLQRNPKSKHFIQFIIYTKIVDN